MHIITFLLLSILSVTPSWADSEPGNPDQNAQAQEPSFYDHYLALQEMQRVLSKRSLEDQTKLQPQVERAERRACQRLREERKQRVSLDDYRQQGGDQFVAFTEQFERYCQTLR